MNNVPLTTVTCSSAGCQCGAILPPGGCRMRMTKGPDFSGSPDSTASLAPGPPRGKDCHLSAPGASMTCAGAVPAGGEAGAAPASPVCVHCLHVAQPATPATAAIRSRRDDQLFMGPPFRAASAARPLPLIELHHLYLARGRGLDAELAQHALVQVLLDDAEIAVLLLREDVDRADLDELLRERRVGRDRRVHLHVDEHARHQCPRRRSCTSAGMSSMRSATEMPAACMRAILSAVVSALPSTIVPAWPKRIPGISSMKRPAMKATIGRRERCSRTQSASSASMRPPGSE